MSSAPDLPDPAAPQAADGRAVMASNNRLLPTSVVPAARAAYHGIHYARWARRFGAFGWGTTLAKPRVRGASYPDVYLGRGVHLGPLWRLEAVPPEFRSDTYTGRPRIEIGDGTSAELGLHIACGTPVGVVIGRDVLINAWVLILDGYTSFMHTLPPRRAPTLAVAPVRIGDGCMLGERSVILHGVELGERCVVGANAVVTKSFPAGSVVGGNPARLLRSVDPSEYVDA